MLVVMLAVAKIGGYLAGRFGQPAVLGELLGGVIVGRSVLGLVDAGNETVHLLSELGVVILLFAIGLETDLSRLFKVGATSLAVAVVGVVLPFVLGFLACRILGLSNIVAIMAGATLTATSVGITARVLSDLGRLHDVEGQIILGAAVIDDILGLMVLSVVTGLAQGKDVTLRGVLLTSAAAIGFLVAAILVGKIAIPRLFQFAASSRTSRNCNDNGIDLCLRACLACRHVWLGAHYRCVRGRPDRFSGRASPRDRARDHSDRPFLRPAFLCRRWSCR